MSKKQTKKKKNSRRKGAVGELEWAKFLRESGLAPEAHRGRQYHGGPDSPDVANDIPACHAEVKRCEQLSLYKAMRQAVGDAGDNIPYVAHRRNNEEWLVVVRAQDLARLAVQVYLSLADN